MVLHVLSASQPGDVTHNGVQEWVCPLWAWAHKVSRYIVICGTCTNGLGHSLE